MRPKNEGSLLCRLRTLPKRKETYHLLKFSDFPPTTVHYKLWEQSPVLAGTRTQILSTAANQGLQLAMHLL